MSGRRLAAVGAALRGLSRVAWFIEDEIAGLPQLVGRGDVCIDVGAEYGLYSQVLADLVGPDGLVVACEPQPEAAQILRRGLAATGVGNTRVCTSAVGHVAGSGVLSVPVRRGRPVHGRAHLVNGFHGPDPNDEFRDGRSVAVDVVTLDQLVDRESLTSVDYVKADVEGAEAQVLHGGRRTIAAHRPIIQLEIESRFTRRFATTPAELVRDVQAMGYRMTGWDGSGWAPLDGVSPSRRNYVFLPVD